MCLFFLGCLFVFFSIVWVGLSFCVCVYVRVSLCIDVSVLVFSGCACRSLEAIFWCFCVSVSQSVCLRIWGLSQPQRLFPPPFCGDLRAMRSPIWSDSYLICMPRCTAVYSWKRNGEGGGALSLISWLDNWQAALLQLCFAEQHCTNTPSAARENRAC